MKAQQLKLEECKDLEGFEELSAAMLGVFKVRPVIGFQDGWMYVGSSAGAVKKVLDTKAGNGETMEGTEAFQKLKLEVDGSGDSIAYANTAENTRNVAKALSQIGVMAPMIMGMAGANANQEDMKPHPGSARAAPGRGEDHRQVRLPGSERDRGPSRYRTGQLRETIRHRGASRRAGSGRGDGKEVVCGYKPVADDEKPPGACRSGASLLQDVNQGYSP